MKKTLKMFPKTLFNVFIIFFFIKINCEISNFQFPKSLILLDNSVVLVHNNGIHFYNNDLTEEYSDKAKAFTIYNTQTYNNIIMHQFPAPDGYILILVDTTLYIFQKDKSFIDSKSIAECSGSFDLIPYKVEGNNLHFIIAYSGSGIINLNVYTFTINTKILSATNIPAIRTYNEDGNECYKNLNGLYCFFMSPLESSGINNDLLTCIANQADPHVFLSVTFDPSNNYNEIRDLRDHMSHISIKHNYTYFYAKANDYKEKILIYVISDYHPFLATFDYTDKFSYLVPEALGNHPQLAPEKYKHKIFFFSQTNDFVIISTFADPEFCNKYIMVFYDDCRLKYKGILYFPQDKSCNYDHSATIIYINDNNNYDVMIDSGNSNLMFNSEYGLEIIERNDETEKVTPTTIITTILTTILTTIPTTISTTIITTIPTTIITTIPTTIITTIPTTIITNIPTTIFTTIQTTIITIIPTTTVTTIQTTILTVFPTTIQTNIITTISTTIITIVQATIITTIPTTIISGISTIININKLIYLDF